MDSFVAIAGYAEVTDGEICLQVTVEFSIFFKDIVYPWVFFFWLANVSLGELQRIQIHYYQAFGNIETKFEKPIVASSIH